MKSVCLRVIETLPDDRARDPDEGPMVNVDKTINAKKSYIQILKMARVLVHFYATEL